MKTIATNNTVTNSPNLTSTGFTIRPKNLGKIINIVENDIYSDKILAVIREYSCNAYDANVEAGKRETPIVVSLPSRLSSEFKVRDYGNGLTEAEIHEIYTSYGESTKEDSDDYIGQLGIGSKSGFAYGENFVVTSWKNGVKTIYNAVKGTNERQMVKLFSLPSDEPSGIEVTIPVKNGDEVSFKNKSIEFFKYWKIQPKLIGASQQEIDSFQTPVILEGKGWQITKSFNSKWSGVSAIAIMGNISYPIHWGLVQDKLRTHLDSMTQDRTRFMKLLPFITNNRFVIRFGIGDVQMAPSREALQYTDHTVNGIVKRLLEIANEIESVVLNIFNNCTTLWEYKSTLNSIFGRVLDGSYYCSSSFSCQTGFYNMASIEVLYDLVRTKLHFNGINAISGRYENVSFWDVNRGKLPNVLPAGTSLCMQDNAYESIVTNHHVNSSDKLIVESPKFGNQYFQIVASKYSHFVIMDTDRKSNVKQCIKWYISEGAKNPKLNIKHRDPKLVYALRFGNDAVRTAFFNAFDIKGATIVNFSQIFELYKPLIPKRQSSAAKLEDDTVYCGVINPGNHFSYYRRNALDTLPELKANVDLKAEKGFYVDISNANGNFMINGKVITPWTFFSNISLLKNAGVDFGPITRVQLFGSRIMTGKKFARNKQNWTNFVTYMEEVFRNFDKSSFVASSVMHERINDPKQPFYIQKAALVQIAQYFPKNHLLQELHDAIPSMPSNIQERLGILNTLHVEIVHGKSVEVKNTMERYFDTIIKKYPMLKTLLFLPSHKNVSGQIPTTLVQEIVDYIKLVDSVQSNG